MGIYFYMYVMMCDSFLLQAIIVPGDNDIGGEDEPPSPELERRFNKYFREDVFIVYQFLEFVKVYQKVLLCI